MYDTLYLNYDIVENPSTISERVFLNTKGTTVTRHLDTEDRFISGDLGNLKLRMSPHTVSIKGSVCKYHLGNNLYSLNRETTKEAIESISDAVGLDMGKARVSRLDWSANISTELPPTLYMPKLGNLSRFTRTENPYSIYYNQTSKRLLFYDKKVEAKKKGVIIPNEFLDKNLLRYEMVLNKGINKYLNTDVRGSALFREDTYKKVADLWIMHYHNINKLNDKGINIITANIRTEGDLDKALLTGLLKQLGMKEIELLFKRLKSEGIFKHNEYYSRLRSKYKKMCQVEIDSEDIISEVNKKIDEIYLNLI